MVYYYYDQDESRRRPMASEARANPPQGIPVTDQPTYKWRMDGPVVVWEENDADKGISCTFLNCPDVMVLGPDMTVDPLAPTDNAPFTVNAVVRNLAPSDALGDIVVRLFDGNPASGGTQLGSDQIITDGIAKQGSAQVAFAVPGSVPDGTHELFVKVFPVDRENPANNVGSTSVLVRDSDTQGPAFANVAITDYEGDGDGSPGI